MIIVAGVQVDVKSEDWFTGSEPVTTTSFLFSSGQVIPEKTVVAVNRTTAEAVVYNPSGSDGEDIPVFITVYDINTTDGSARHAVYKGGIFNQAIVSELFAGTPISVQTPVGHSDETTEPPVQNDFVLQASDSGWSGELTYWRDDVVWNENHIWRDAQG